MISRRLIPNALELTAADPHDRHPDFIMKLRITFHLQRAALVPDRECKVPCIATSSRRDAGSTYPNVHRVASETRMGPCYNLD